MLSPGGRSLDADPIPGWVRAASLVLPAMLGTACGGPPSLEDLRAEHGEPVFTVASAALDRGTLQVTGLRRGGYAVEDAGQPCVLVYLEGNTERLAEAIRAGRRRHPFASPREAFLVGVAPGGRVRQSRRVVLHALRIDP